MASLPVVALRVANARALSYAPGLAAKPAAMPGARLIVELNTAALRSLINRFHVLC